MGALAMARQQLAEALEAELGGAWDLFPDPNTLRDTITRPAIIISRSKVEPLPAAPVGHLLNTFTLSLIDNKTADEDHLDDLLSDLLDALQDVAQVTWTDATRATFNGTNPAYEITIQAPQHRKA